MQKKKKLEFSPSQKNRVILTRMVISAMFLALAVVLNVVTKVSIPIFGANGMQIKLGGIFTSFPAFMFGPIYGGVVCAASDVISALLRPTGPYVVWFTLTAFLAGFIKGLVFKLIKDSRATFLKKALAVFVLICTIVGIFCFASVKNDKVYSGAFPTSESILSASTLLQNSDSYSMPTKIALKYAISNAQRQKLPDDPSKHAGYQTLDYNGKSIILRTDKFTSGFASTLNIMCAVLLGLAVLGCILVVFLYVSEKKIHSDALGKIFVSVLCAELVQTSINTGLFFMLYAGTYGNFSYWLLNTPRVIEGIFMSMLLSYFIFILYEVYEAKIKKSFKLL